MNYTRFFLFLSVLLIAFSCNDHDLENVRDRKYIKKQSIIVGNQKFDGPEKYMYYHAAVKHGNDDLSQPSIHKQYKPGYKNIELKKAIANLNKSQFVNQSRSGNNTFSAYAKDNAVFIERGPYNVPGRTRGILVDAADPSGNTWIAGSVGGGLWKTSDEGVTWNSITSEMDNIAISWLAQSPSNPSIIYVGTGESWVGSLGDIDGAGVYKSSDGGNSWSNISPKDDEGYVDPNFTNISRIISDPNDSDIVLISTEGSNGTSKIYKSTDGGLSWVQRYNASSVIQQIIASPSDFNIQYAAINGVGVMRSVDAGSSWTNPGGIGMITTLSYDNEDGILQGSGGGNFGRLEVAVSHQDPNTLYAGVNGNSASYLRVSYDGGTTWNLLKNEDDTDDDWLESIGWYANTLNVNPFNDSIIYYGSQDAAKAKVLPIDGTSFSGSAAVVSLDNISSHLNLVNIWGGSTIGNDTEWADNSEKPQLVDIEVRFGPGKKQKAYRFSVPEGATYGVPHNNYKYQGDVEVPFEAWNISADPEEQITISFRDNNNNGVFDLLPDQGDSREYIFPQNVSYDPTMSQADIVGDGTPENSASLYGQLYKTLYLLWPYLANGVSWDPDNIPESSIKIELVNRDYKTLTKSEQILTNYYGNNGTRDVNVNVHVDHHSFETIIDSETDSTFRVLLTTDGGVYNTVSGKDPGSDGDFLQGGIQGGSIWFTPAGGYNTTQFYGADKIVGVDRYIGGAQDNGTFGNLNGKFGGDDVDNANATTNYDYLIGGDGFEVIAHHTDPNKLIGGSQFNNFWYTHNGGDNWTNVYSDLEGNGPFVNRVSTSYQLPDVLAVVSDAGVNISQDFGASWENTRITGSWGFWSGTDVEVSMANPRFIWAGGRMTSTGKIFLSKDYGTTFEPVNNYNNVGVISGLYSHPTEDSTAYVLFGYKGYAKVIETKDLGQSWVDITGFENENGTFADYSNNGFPDVAVYSFLVMPHNTDIMWAGTEIGLFESTNNGQTWHKVIGDLPNVTIWDMKIKDEGQVVIATHGRGIWTATLEDLKNFVPKPTILPPVIVQAAQSEREDAYEINIKVELMSAYDSLDIIANGNQSGRFYDTDDIGERDYMIGVNDFGDFELQAIGYENGVQYQSAIYNIVVSPVLAPRTEFSTNFSDLVGDEFYLDRFRIGAQGGFEGRQLHSDHPYKSAVSQGYSGNEGYSLVAMLNIPIIITDFTPSIRFNEIAIVETGESGTSFGDYEFWDYVIVEASKDGNNWKPLIDGYDSDAYADWKVAYQGGAFGTPDLLKDRQINFKPHFNEGDTVKVRFRLYSDPLTVGWGWLVDDLYIQKETPVVQGIEFTKLDENISVFPNPNRGKFNIKFSDVWDGDVDCEIIDIFGRPIYNNVLNNISGSSSHNIDISSRNDGVFILNLVQGDKKTMFKIIKE